MVTLKGKKASPGIAKGKIVFKKPSTPDNEEYIRNKIFSTDAEKEKFGDAVEKCKSELKKLKEKAAVSDDPSSAAIFDIHEMMICDEDFSSGVVSAIDSGLFASDAVKRVAKNLADTFSTMNSEYMRARTADLKDVSERIISIIKGENTSFLPSEKCILFCEELTPSETVSLDKNTVLGIICEKGSPTSHSSILARTLGIPTVVGVGTASEAFNGKQCVLDGESGIVYIDPDRYTNGIFEKRFSAEKKEKDNLEEYRGKLSVTADGKRIKVFANIESIEDAKKAAENDAEGIGLFRSEFLFMNRNSPPDEDEQFEFYKSIGEKLKGRRITVRTLDAGADKIIPYINSESEANPALGYRAIRICLENEKLFKEQIKAVYRASAYVDISIMFPMISSLDELLKAKEICRSARAELKKAGIPFSANTEIGIMIETPAAAICADILARHCDFFSIGTNDLVQYTVAADRENEKVSYLTEKMPEAVKRLIKHVAKCANNAEIEVGICGEFAADVSLMDFFISVGIKKLSVSPVNILKVRKAVFESGKTD